MECCKCLQVFFLMGSIGGSLCIKKLLVFNEASGETFESLKVNEQLINSIRYWVTCKHPKQPLAVVDQIKLSL